MDDVLILLVIVLSALLTYGLVILSDESDDAQRRYSRSASTWSLLLLVAKPLGATWRAVYRASATLADPVLVPVERLIYRLLGVDPRATRWAGSATRWRCWSSTCSACWLSTPSSGCRAACRSTRRICRRVAA